MEKSPFFSIVIPCLNEEETLPRLLRHLVLQKEKDFEVVVIDGKSEDKTVEKANSFKKSLALSVFVIRKKNVAAARNYGATKAKGKYLIFFDADVQIPDNFLEKLRQDLEKENFPLLATTYVFPESKDWRDYIFAWPANIGLGSLIGKPFVYGFNVIIEKNFFEKIAGFREDLILGEDHDLSIRAKQKGVLLRIFPQPVLIFSTRRAQREGRLKLLLFNLYTLFRHILFGPVKEGVKYEMGGRAH